MREMLQTAECDDVCLSVISRNYQYSNKSDRPFCHILSPKDDHHSKKMHFSSHIDFTKQTAALV